MIFMFLAPALVVSDENELDPTKIGVKDGDQFTYILESYTVFIPQSFVLGLDPETNNTLTVVENTEFTVTVVNASVVTDITGNYTILINVDNGTSNLDFPLRMSPVSIITLTDWDYWEREVLKMLEILTCMPALLSSDYSLCIPALFNH